jgi:hypothetical protein
MFDYVRSEVPLPDLFEGELQSKDFDCAMTIILIRADGRLLIEDFEQEIVPQAERPHPDADPGSIMALCGSIRSINKRWLDLDYHGDFNFYGISGKHGQPDYRWHEYVARFSNGHLDYIRDMADAQPTVPQP